MMKVFGTDVVRRREHQARQQHREDEVGCDRGAQLGLGRATTRPPKTSATLYGIGLRRATSATATAAAKSSANASTPDRTTLCIG